MLSRMSLKSSVDKNVEQIEVELENNIPKFDFEIVNGLEGFVSKEEYDELLSPNDNDYPFLKYDFLYNMEKTGIASTKSGWEPVHVIARSREDKKMKMMVPMYVKSHSYGEFIFDQSWAEFAMRRLGIRYYPKLLCAIPCTPAVGTRVILHKELCDESKSKLVKDTGDFIASVASNNGLSGAHFNFMLKEEAEQLDDSKYMLRETIQYRFTNKKAETKEKYEDFDDYLSSFKSKRRVQIKRERRSVYEDQSIRVETITGDEADLEMYKKMYLLYTTTVDKMWGQRYMTEDFFISWFHSSLDFKKNIVFIVAYDDSDNIVAGTINFIQHNDQTGTSKFFGRYWGAFEELKFLHFECCYYKTIEYVIENKIDYFEPGAGGGSFKFLRGFDPYIVYSKHYISSPILREAIGEFLKEEREYNNDTADYLIENSALKKNKNENTTIESNKSE